MKIKKYDVFIWILIVIVGVINYLINKQRVISGFFTSEKWIYWDSSTFIIFSGLITGYVVAKILKMNGNKK